MPRTCTVCNHKDVEKINERLLCSDSYRDIARQFGLSKDALARHKESHIPELLSKSKDIKEATSADKLLAQLEEAREKTNRLLDLAVEAADTKTYGAPSNYLAELRQQIKLWAELEGRIREQQVTVSLQQSINIYESAEWLAVGDLLARILAPHPELRAQVARELLALQEAHR
jgi:hypothetical protein